MENHLAKVLYYIRFPKSIYFHFWEIHFLQSISLSALLISHKNPSFLHKKAIPFYTKVVSNHRQSLGNA